jgi:UDP-N-acetylglucosamine 1-carboxyvinyltransferase
MVNQKLIEMGCELSTRKNGLTVKGPKKLKPVKITTFPFPGYPTDLQACAMAAATLAEGTSHIIETVYVDRFSHTMELRRLGAKIEVLSTEAVITGVDRLTGASVMAPDIRAGAGITLACLAATGKSEILRVYHVDRGYHRLEEKLAALGADIKRERENG